MTVPFLPPTMRAVGVHPTTTAGELNSDTDWDLWKAFEGAAGSAVASVMWHMATGGPNLHSAERLTLIALAFHVDLSYANGLRYEGSHPSDLRVFTGATTGRCRENLKLLADWGWCVRVGDGRPALFRLSDSILKMARFPQAVN